MSVHARRTSEAVTRRQVVAGVVQDQRELVHGPRRDRHSSPLKETWKLSSARGDDTTPMGHRIDGASGLRRGAERQHNLICGSFNTIEINLGQRSLVDDPTGLNTLAYSQLAQSPKICRISSSTRDYEFARPPPCKKRPKPSISSSRSLRGRTCPTNANTGNPDSRPSARRAVWRST